MESCLRYPLNRAHYNQRRAEAKESVGQYSSALEFRKIALKNLKEALTSTSVPTVKESILSQIAIEEKRIEYFYLVNTNGLELYKIVKGFGNRTNMAEANLTNKFSGSPATENYKHCRNYIQEIIQNTESIGKIASEIELKLNPAKVAEPEAVCEAMPVRPSERVEGVNDLVRDLEICRSGLPEPDQKNYLEGSNSSYALPQLPEDYSSSSFSIEEFAPLPCPSLDFLTNVRREDPLPDS